MRFKLQGGYEPIRGHEEDAGIDLRTPIALRLNKGDSVVVDTLVSVEIPKGYYGKLESKSGLNVNHSIVSLGGVIDCGYSGTIKVKLYNFGEDYEFKEGDKIVQLVVIPCDTSKVEIVDEIYVGDRGEDGFGSTGK